VALPADQLGLKYSDLAKAYDQAWAGGGALAPGSVANMDPSPYWHGRPPYQVMEPPILPWESWNILDTAAIGTGYFRVVPESPPDHRYDKILEEFRAKPVQPAPVPYTAEPAIWTPPPGAFPEPEPETVLSFPKYEQREGRWVCSVVVALIISPGTRNGVDWSYSPSCWLMAEPCDAQGQPIDDGRPVYQKWAVMSPVQVKLQKMFQVWVTEIEANPECCVKHKLIGRYDGEVCVGQRSTQPPVGLAPEEPKMIPPQSNSYDKMTRVGIIDIFQTSPIFEGLSGRKLAGQIMGGNNITVSSPRTGFKLHGIIDEP
jgi:hypothetical protein